jgi:uncharacterized protein YdeI (YjbR/CyaY-like superfamily)
MAAFKEHCSFGLWGSEMAETLKAGGIESKDSMGSFGRIESLKDLPPKKELIAYVKRAAALIGDGTRVKSIQRVAKPSPRAEAEVPSALAAALGKDKAAQQRFHAMSPSCRREYCEWIADAKREETRDKRVAQAVGWIVEGKSRNWQYEKRA